MALGYMSKAYVCGTQVLGTGSSLAPTFQYLQSDGVRGAGYLQAGLSVFAWNYKQWEGSIDWDVGSDGALGEAKKWAVSERKNKNSLKAEPGGYATMMITGYNSGLSVSTSAGSLVTASASAQSFGDDGNDVSGGTPSEPNDIDGETKWCGNDGVVPYWKSSASIGGSSGGGCGAIEWSISIENGLVPVLCCQGSSGNNGFYEPYAIYLGPTEATIEVTVLGELGVTDFSDRKVSASINCGDGTSFTVKGIVTGVTGGIQTGDSICGLGLSIKSVACDEPAVS